uniref:Uncharacterized protein n=1 Tax=Siphoviridae sp. cttFh17 TaxID=2826491 RepID=A0A8S5NJJ7_9CAUD|nr:MAG TPA: hypothetical protein [Siphoviridae sp. cttFh17]
MIIIKTLHFEDCEDFAYDVSDVYERVKSDDEYNSVDVVAKYEDAKNIIAELVENGHDLAHISDFARPDHDNYNDEYLIALDHEGIWCEPAKRENGYLYATGVVCYVMDNCNSKIISSIQSKVVYEVNIGDDNCDGDCDHCDCKEIDKDYYSINGKQVSQAEFEKKTKEIQKTYDSLNDWLDIVDAFPEIYKRLMNYACYLDKLDESFWY